MIKNPQKQLFYDVFTIMCETTLPVAQRICADMGMRIDVIADSGEPYTHYSPTLGTKASGIVEKDKLYVCIYGPYDKSEFWRQLESEVGKNW